MNPLLEQFLSEARENLAFIEQNIEGIGGDDLLDKEHCGEGPDDPAVAHFREREKLFRDLLHESGKTADFRVLQNQHRGGNGDQRKQQRLDKVAGDHRPRAPGHRHEHHHDARSDDDHAQVHAEDGGDEDRERKQPERRGKKFADKTDIKIELLGVSVKTLFNCVQIGDHP